jgi:hypothetical protein
MKRSLRVTSIGLLAILIVGCGTTYTIRTTDGREYHSAAKPDLTDDRYVKFETTDGREVLLKQKEVSSISED